MSIKQLHLTLIISLIAILSSQGYLVYEYFQTTKAGLVRESEAIIQEAFRYELDQRHAKYKKIIGEDTITTPPPPPPSSQIESKYNLNKFTKYSDNILGMYDMVINMHVSTVVPLNLQHLDSITANILLKRKIQSEYAIRIVDIETGKITEQSKQTELSSLFLISSKSLIIDAYKHQAIQLVLVNPFAEVVKRMILMLITSISFAMICVFVFIYLQGILARQKQLIIFKNEFLGNIAHELKRPVASLTLNLDCIDSFMNNENNQQYALYIKNAINSTDEMNDTINMIVALTKMEEGLLTLKNESIDLQSLFLDLKNRFLQSTAKEVQINIYTETDNTHLMGDYRLLWQCFANIIDNAIKYSNNKVQVDITIRQQEHWMAISVKDNGRGISEDNLQLIFNKYSRIDTDNSGVKGFGIGLNYVKNIIEKHKGKINVSSKAGEGSVFTILLPG